MGSGVGPMAIVCRPPPPMSNWIRFVSAAVMMPYKRAWEMRGMEALLMDYLVERPFIEELYDRIFALDGEILRRCTEAGADMIGFGGDIAIQDAAKRSVAFADLILGHSYENRISIPNWMLDFLWTSRS